MVSLSFIETRTQYTQLFTFYDQIEVGKKGEAMYLWVFAPSRREKYTIFPTAQRKVKTKLNVCVHLKIQI